MPQTSVIKNKTIFSDEKDPFVQLVKHSEPILIRDASKTEEENQVLNSNKI